MARVRPYMALMEKLSGTSWGADPNIQKKLYLGRVRPVYSCMGNSPKLTFDKNARIQTKATRITTGALKSTPIQASKAEGTPKVSPKLPKSRG